MKLQRGMTLIELMVALGIGLGVVAAVTSIMVVGENHKRATTSTNDAEQTGAYAFYFLDRALRSAGSGFAATAFGTDAGVLGCRLNAGSFLPATAAFPAPFSINFLNGTGASATAILGNLRVAPVLIGPNQSDGGSDVLVIMGTTGVAGGVARQFDGNGNSSSLYLANTVGFSQYDLGLVSQSGTPDCLVEEVSSTPPSGATSLALNSALPYYTTGSTTTLSTLAGSTSSYLTPLGNAGNPGSPLAYGPSFQLIGVGANRILYSYDLLQNLSRVQGIGAQENSQPIADSVDSIHAIYGIATPGGGITYASPSDPGYDIGSVMTSEVKIESIVAVHVALIMRGEYKDKYSSATTTTSTTNFRSVPLTLTYFTGITDSVTGTSLATTINLATGYRYRLFEFTIPVRNMLLLNGLNVT